MFMTDAGKRDIPLVYVLYIHYPVQFRKDDNETQALLNSRSEVNAINPAYAKKLGLWVQKTNVGTQKIDGSSLDTFGIVRASF